MIRRPPDATAPAPARRKFRGTGITQSIRRGIATLLVLGFSLPLAAWAQNCAGGIVLLTFDTEFTGDAGSIEDLELEIPLTFFWTGSYAQRHPMLLRRLASAGHTIGSHSFHHDDLTTLPERHLQLDLLLSKLLLENAAGVPVRWFRAPFLQYDEQVMRQVVTAGYEFDSSDKSPWPRNVWLNELAVSSFENRLVSDYDIFERGELDNAAGLDFLIAASEHYASRGRPLVVLLHPRFIGKRAEVLSGFIEHVQSRSGRFLTLDGYDAYLRESTSSPRLALWLDAAVASFDFDHIVTEAATLGVSDVFLPAPDGSRIDALDTTSNSASSFAETVAAFQAHGIRVHATLSVTANTELARSSRDTAMVDILGMHSERWVSPSHPEVRKRLVETAIKLVRDFGVDGLNLPDAGYPDLHHDFSLAALTRFGTATGIAERNPEALLNLHYGQWVNWRVNEITGLVKEIGSSINTHAGPGFEFSASLVAESAIDYRAEEWSGQDLSRLAPHLDVILPVFTPAVSRDPSAVARILFAAGGQAGNTKLLPVVGVHGGGLASAANPPRADADIRNALVIGDGVVVRHLDQTRTPTVSALLGVPVQDTLREKRLTRSSSKSMPRPKRHACRD